MKDLEPIYDKEIAPLMDRILKVCARERIPVFAHFELGKGLACTSCIAAPFSSERFKAFMEAAKNPEPLKYAGIAVMDDGEVVVTGSEGYTESELDTLKKKARSDWDKKKR